MKVKFVPVTPAGTLCAHLESRMIAMEQLKNGITAIENGKGPDDIIQEHAFGAIDLGNR